jgi:glycosyltransferase involved in cell wall biosynthesis
MTTVAFVLVSWRPDIPAGMERAVAAHAAGLADAGHRAVIITADHTAPAIYRSATVAVLTTLKGTFPCDDATLRTAINVSADALRDELVAIFTRELVDVVVYIDALWGLGRIMPTHPRTRSILAVHVVGHDADLHAALTRQPAAVIAPSCTVLAEAAARAYDTGVWKIVPNALLTAPNPQPQHHRDQLFRYGPVRVLARLGPEKGVATLLQPRTAFDRPIEVALANAPFELTAGSQEHLLRQCQALAAKTPGVTIRSGLTWDEVPAWLGEASLVIVPSHAETFGLVALEAMAASTPVIAHDVGNLPALIDDGGVIVPRRHGADGLWRAARSLLSDAVRYRRTSRAAYYRSRDYWPALVANQLLKVVS